MIILGIDWGRARTGVAVSDELGLMAHPAAFIEEESPSKVAEELTRLAAHHRANEIVIGLPLNMDGTEGESAADVRRLAKRLEESTGLPVLLRDERLTTWQAERFLIEERGMSRQKRKKTRDQMAACLILQGYLDYKKSNP